MNALPHVKGECLTEAELCLLRAPAGLHPHHVLPAVLEGQEASLLRDPPEPDAGQPGGRPALGPGHLLPQRQEVLRARGHGEEPHDPASPRRHRPVWPQVSSGALPRDTLAYLSSVSSQVSSGTLPCDTLAYLSSVSSQVSSDNLLS